MDETREPTLRMQAVHGVKWTGISTIVTTILLYGRLAVLAHLLSPKDFGLMGMIIVILGIGQAFSDVGLSQSIIWKQDSTREQLSSLYWFNILASLAVFCIAIAISPLVAAFFHQPQLVGLMVLAAFIFPVTAAGSQFQTLMQKSLEFKRLAMVEISSASVGAAVSIIVALIHPSVLALIWGQLAICATASFLYSVMGIPRWRPMLVLNFKNLGDYISFGLYQVGQQVVNAYAVNVDYIMVGRFLGPQLLGVYMLAWQIMVAPMTKLNPVLTRVAFPVFAKRQTDDESLQSGYIELSKMVAMLTLPITLLAAATASVFVPVIFGPKWSAAVPIIQIFALLGLFRSLSNPVWSMLFAKGRADTGFRLTVAVAAVSTLAFWIAAQRGLFTMAWTEVIVDGLFFFVVLAILHRLIGLGFSAYAKDVGMPTVLALLSAGATYGCYHLLKSAIKSDVWLLVALVAIGFLLYSTLILTFEREYFMRYVRLLLRGNKTPANIF